MGVNSRRKMTSDLVSHLEKQRKVVLDLKGTQSETTTSKGQLGSKRKGDR